VAARAWNQSQAHPAQWEVPLNEHNGPWQNCCKKKYFINAKCCGSLPDHPSGVVRTVTGMK
jgi:hypothetical protein